MNSTRQPASQRTAVDSKLLRNPGRTCAALAPSGKACKRSLSVVVVFIFALLGICNVLVGSWMAAMLPNFSFCSKVNEAAESMSAVFSISILMAQLESLELGVAK